MGDKVLSQSEVDSVISVKTPGPPANAARPAERPALNPPMAKPISGQPARPFTQSAPATANRLMAQSGDSDEPVLPEVKEISLNDIWPAPQTGTPGPSADTVAELTARIDEMTRRMGILEDQLTHQIAISDMARLTKPEINPDKFEMLSNRVEEFSEGIKIMAARLQATPGYDLYHTFQCDKCGSKGYVATLFKCTKCGGESWRGWWPKKSSK